MAATFPQTPKLSLQTPHGRTSEASSHACRWTAISRQNTCKRELAGDGGGLPEIVQPAVQGWLTDRPCLTALCHRAACSQTSTTGYTLQPSESGAMSAGLPLNLVWSRILCAAKQGIRTTNSMGPSHPRALQKLVFPSRSWGENQQRGVLGDLVRASHSHLPCLAPRLHQSRGARACSQSLMRLFRPRACVMAFLVEGETLRLHRSLPITIPIQLCPLHAVSEPRRPAAGEAGCWRNITCSSLLLSRWPNRPARNFRLAFPPQEHREAQDEERRSPVVIYAAISTITLRSA